MMNHHLSIFIFIQLSFYATIVAFMWQRTHLLMSLLCLEGMMLNLVLFIPTILYMSEMIIPTLSIMMLTFGACEASLGLSMMVHMSRAYGSDMLNSTTLNKC